MKNSQFRFRPPGRKVIWYLRLRAALGVSNRFIKSVVKRVVDEYSKPWL